MRLNILRCIRFLLDFFSQRRHEDAQGSDVVVPAAAPDVLRDEGMRQNLSDVLGEQTQEFVFDGSQMQLLFSDINAAGGLIDTEVSVCKGRGFGRRIHRGCRKVRAAGEGAFKAESRAGKEDQRQSRRYKDKRHTGREGEKAAHFRLHARRLEHGAHGGRCARAGISHLANAQSGRSRGV